MTSLNVGECYNNTMKRVGCDPHIKSDKVAILKCHDENEEDFVSSNTKYKVCVEAKMRHMQDEGNK